MTLSAMPRFSITSESRGNISPSAVPNTVTAATAAGRLTTRCLAMGFAPHVLAAREAEAEDERQIDCGERQRHGIDAEDIHQRPSDRRSDQTADPPHGGEGSRSRNQVRTLEAITHDG